MPARAFLLERKAAYAAAGTSAGDDAAAGAGGKKPPLTSVQHAEQLVALLRQAHAPLAAEIELVLDELTGRFAPSAEVRVKGKVRNKRAAITPSRVERNPTQVVILKSEQRSRSRLERRHKSWAHRFPSASHH